VKSVEIVSLDGRQSAFEAIYAAKPVSPDWREISGLSHMVWDWEYWGGIL